MQEGAEREYLIPAHQTAKVVIDYDFRKIEEKVKHRSQLAALAAEVPDCAKQRALGKTPDCYDCGADYPMIMDTFGCTQKFLTDNPKAAKALADSYFEAIAMIEKDQAKSYEIMGADVKQSGEQFGNSAKYLRWQDKAANQKFFVSEFQAFNKEAADLLLEIGIIKSVPKMYDLFDASFIK